VGFPLSLAISTSAGDRGRRDTLVGGSKEEEAFPEAFLSRVSPFAGGGRKRLSFFISDVLAPSPFRFPPAK
jgi:hypothetical protein